MPRISILKSMDKALRKVATCSVKDLYCAISALIFRKSVRNTHIKLYEGYK